MFNHTRTANTQGRPHPECKSYWSAVPTPLFDNISQLLSDSFSVSQLPLIWEPPFHYSMFTSHFTSRVSFTMHSLHHCRAWLHDMSCDSWHIPVIVCLWMMSSLNITITSECGCDDGWLCPVRGPGDDWVLAPGPGCCWSLSVSTLLSGHLTSPTLSSRHVSRVLQCLEFRGQNPEMATTSTFSLLNTTFTLSRIYYDTIIVNGCWNNWHL